LQAELDELGQAERALRGSSERASGTLDVAAHPQLAHQVLLPALPRFHALHPEVEVDFQTAMPLSKRWAGGRTTRSPAPTGGSSVRSPARVNRQSASPGTVGNIR
jgi:hypothetical protein